MSRIDFKRGCQAIVNFAGPIVFAGVHEPLQQGQQLRGIAQLGSPREGGGAHRYDRSFRLVALNLNIVGAQKAKYSPSVPNSEPILDDTWLKVTTQSDGLSNSR